VVDYLFRINNAGDFGAILAASIPRRFMPYHPISIDMGVAIMLIEND